MAVEQFSPTGTKRFRLQIPHAHKGPMANAGGAPAPAAPSTPSAADVAAGIEALNRSFEAFKAANDARFAELNKGKPDVITTEKVDRINASVTELDQTVRAMSDQLRAAAVIGSAAGAEGQTAEARAYSATFANWVRGRAADVELKAAAMVPGAFQAAMSTQSDPDGGFLLPAPSVSAMTRVLEVVSAMRGLAEVITVSGSVHKKPHNLGGAMAGWVGEVGGRSQTANAQLSELAFPTYEMYAMPAATQGLLDDAAANVDAWIGSEGAIAFAEREGGAWINGNAATQPQGLLAAPKIANASYSWGKLGFVASGVAAALNDVSNNGADALINLQHSLKAGYRPGAAFLLNDATVGQVRKLKDADGAYLWNPTVTLGIPSTLLGDRAVVDDNMPDVAANAFPILYGDFRRGYLIIDRIGIRVLRDPYSSKPYVLFYMTKRVGGGYQDYAAIKALKVST